LGEAHGTTATSPMTMKQLQASSAKVTLTTAAPSSFFKQMKKKLMMAMTLKTTNKMKAMTMTLTTLPLPCLMTVITSKILGTRHITFLWTNLKCKTFNIRTESGQTSVSLRHFFTRPMICRQGPLDGGSDPPCNFAVQGVQKFRNFEKLKLVKTPQTPISLKSSIHKVSEYT
jgi:hypothetical protein